MTLPKTIEGREYKKFLEDNNGDTAVRVVVTSGLQNPVTDLLLSGNHDVDSGANVGTEIGTLLTQGGVGPYIYQITDDPSDKFAISGDRLITDNPIDYFDTQVLSVTIKTTDINDSSYSSGFNITVNQTPAPPFVNTKAVIFHKSMSQYCAAAAVATTAHAKFTASAWITLATIGGEQTIMSLFGANGARSFRFNVGATGKLFVGLSENGVSQQNYVGTETLLAGNKYHVAFAFDGVNGTIQAWVNSVIDIDDITAWETLYNPTIPFRVGARGDSSFPQIAYFDGIIDEPSTYNDALTQIRIEEIYNLGEAANLANMSSSSSLLSWWRMGDGDSYPTLLDQIGSDDLTMYNMTAANIITLNFVSLYSMKFNGVDQRIDTLLDLSGMSEFTIGAWFYRDLTSERMDIAQSNDANSSRVKLIRNSSGAVYGVVDGGSRQFTDNTVGWMYYTMVYDGNQVANNDRIKMYSAGLPLTPASSPTVPTSVSVIDKTFRIGQDNGSGSYGKGNIDEVVAIDRALTDAEVVELYNSGDVWDLATSTFESNIISWWRCGEELVGTNMPDQVGINDGTLVNMNSSDRDTNIP